MRNFDELSEREMLALAIGNEEEDGRIYADFADGLRADYPGTANVFTEMAGEEGEHRRRLIDLYRQKFGEHIPLIRRQDVRGFIRHAPVWQHATLGIDAGAQAGAGDGGGDRSASTARRRRAAPTPRSASCSATSPRSRRSTSTPPINWSPRTCRRTSRTRRRRRSGGCSCCG